MDCMSDGVLLSVSLHHEPSPLQEVALSVVGETTLSPGTSQTIPRMTEMQLNNREISILEKQTIII